MKEPVVLDRWMGRMDLLAWMNAVAHTQYGSVHGLSDCVGYACLLALVAEDAGRHALRAMRMDVREGGGAGGSPTSLSTTRREVGSGARAEREHVLRTANARQLVAALQRAGLHAACGPSPGADEMAEQLGGGHWAAHNLLLQFMHTLHRLNREEILRARVDVVALRAEAHAHGLERAARRAAARRRRLAPRPMSAHLVPGAVGSLRRRGAGPRADGVGDSRHGVFDGSRLQCGGGGGDAPAQARGDDRGHDHDDVAAVHLDLDVLDDDGGGASVSPRARGEEGAEDDSERARREEALDACAELESELCAKLRSLMRMQAELRVGRSECAFLDEKLRSILRLCRAQAADPTRGEAADALASEVAAIVLEEEEGQAAV